MIVVDTSALVAILQDEPEVPDIQRMLDRADRVVIGAPTRFELLMVSLRRPHGQDTARHLLTRLGCTVLDWTPAHADIAADAFVRYGKGRHPAALNFGDCMAYAVAQAFDAPLLFKGHDFALTDVKSVL